jgi:hypothetical protein
MFDTWREVRRLRRSVAALEARLEREEEKREQERERHLAREDALVNLVTTSRGHRGISESSVEPKRTEKPAPEARQLSAEDEATKQYYRQCARDAGLDEGAADEWFAAYLRGEEPMIQVEN